MTSPKEHWNKVYASKAVEQLGWYEEEPGPSLALLARCGLERDELIVDVGAGASTLIDYLLAEGYRNIVATDISDMALRRLKERLGSVQAAQVKWLVDDVTNPTQLLTLTDVALWHDRAMLHFLVAEAQRQQYLTTLRSLVKAGGYVITAAFAVGGATMCSGLDVRNYNRAGLTEFFGPDFRLIEALDYTYQMPSGDLRPYIYTLFQRVA